MRAEKSICRLFFFRPSPLSALYRLSDPREIDVSPVNIYEGQLHTDPVTDIKTLEALDNSPFDREREKPGPGPFFSCSSDYGIELLSNPVFEQHCRR